MKNLLLLALLFPIQLMGQDSLKRKNEIGVLCETNVMDSYGDKLIGTGGFVYKFANSPLLSFTLLAAYTYTYDGFTDYKYPKKATPDSTMWKATSTNTNLATLGFGTEVQRRFYKKLFLFAGADIRLSYGTVVYDTTIVAEIKYSPSFTAVYASYETYPRSELTAIQIALVPSIGLKLALGRFNIGYAMANYLLAYRNERNNTHVYTQTVIGLGTTHQRVFASYLF